MDVRLVRALAWWESGFNNSLVSSAGARGVMQVTPATWSYAELVLVGHRIPNTVSGNVQVGVVFLNHLLREFHGDVRLALAAYAQGPQSVRRHGLFRETRQYVAGVLALSRTYLAAPAALQQPAGQLDPARDRERGEQREREAPEALERLAAVVAEQ